MSAAAEDPLATHRWKHRLILLRLPDSFGGERLETLERSIRDQRAGIGDRDLVLLDYSASDREIVGARHLSNRARDQLANRFDPPDSEPSFILIGKDGGEKARQTDELDLEALFARIDTMPMRQREMGGGR